MILDVQHLTKAYHSKKLFTKARHALDDITFSMNDHEVLGVIGHNGAGKTTLFKCIMGFIFPDKGEIRSLNKKQIGYLPESPHFHNELTAEEHLDYYARLFDIPWRARKERIQTLLKETGLDRVKKTRLSTFSKGMLQRFGIAQSLLNQPKLLILDEPIIGLDPMGRDDVVSLIQSSYQSGASVLLSSHQLHDLEELCDRIAVMKQGRLLSCSDAKNFVDTASENFKEYFVYDE
ncbi:MAG: ABC transporter ATP-binding protein [Gammaproteobacteria bacterium]